MQRAAFRVQRAVDNGHRVRLTYENPAVCPFVPDCLQFVVPHVLHLQAQGHNRARLQIFQRLVRRISWRTGPPPPSPSPPVSLSSPGLRGKSAGNEQIEDCSTWLLVHPGQGDLLDLSRFDLSILRLVVRLTL